TTPESPPSASVPTAKQDYPINSREKIVEKSSGRPKLGIAFGGGAAKGFAHVGAIAVLEKAGIHPDLVVGTSAGSIIAAIYASGMGVPKMLKVVENFKESDVRDLTLSGKGFVEGKKLEEYVNTLVNNRTIEQLPIPYGAVATNSATGEGILFRRGNVGQAARASSSVPGVFIPVKIGKNEYVDGGLTSPVPVSYAKQMGADIVVAIDISDRAKFNSPSGIFSLINQTFTIVQEKILNQELKAADIVVQPNISEIGSTELDKKMEAVKQACPINHDGRPRLALALGGGATKGYAHIGVLRMLDHMGVIPDMIIGTSAGSLVGALYAAGMSSAQLSRLALQLEESDIRDLTLSRQGLVKGEKLQNLVNNFVQNQPIEAFLIPFAAVATEPNSGHTVILDHGNAGLAVRASCSIPGVFIPVEVGGRLLVDGGVSCPVPVSVARELGADIVIAVDISGKPEQDRA
ncbi:unnamed protein product, partial [Darwinula stevensoni]